MQITAAVREKGDGVVTRRNIKLEKVELDDPCEDEVLIKVTRCGGCGTDTGIIRFEDINRAIDDSDNHETIKPIVRMR